MITFFIIMIALEIMALTISFRLWRNSEKQLRQSIRAQELNQRLRDKFEEIDEKNRLKILGFGDSTDVKFISNIDEFKAYYNDSTKEKQ